MKTPWPFLAAVTLTAAAVLLSDRAAARPERNAPSPSAAVDQEPWDAPEEAKQVVNPVKMDPKTVERGARVYRQFCLPCHGETGVGDGPLAKAQGYKPADLTLARLNPQADGEIFWKVSKGKPPMPSFDKQLSARERWDVVSYVRTLLKEIE